MHRGPQDPIDRLLAGEQYFEDTEIPLAHAIDIRRVPVGKLRQYLDLARSMQHAEQSPPEDLHDFRVVDMMGE